MKLRERLEKKKKKLQDQMQRGREVTAQMKAEKLRKKMQKSKTYESGTIRYGLAHKQNPLDLMSDAYERRKQKRKEKDTKRK